MIYIGAIIGVIATLAVKKIFDKATEDSWWKGFDEAKRLEQENTKSLTNEAFEQGYRAGYEEGRYAKEVNEQTMK